MGRFLLSRSVPLGLGFVLLLSAVLLRRELRPRKPAKPRACSASIRSVSLDPEMQEPGSLQGLSDSALDERIGGEAECTAADILNDSALLSWQAASAYIDDASMDAALADFRSVMALEWDPLTSDSLEKELELTPAQKERIDDLRTRCKAEEELWKTHSLVESEVARKLEEVQDRYRDLIRRELTPDQQEKYDALDSATLRRRVALLRDVEFRFLEAIGPENP